jgi:hypothetical protein
LAKGLIRLAVKVGDSFLPLIMKPNIVFRRHSNKRATSINNSWVGLGLFFFDQGCRVVKQVFGVEGPRSNLTLIVARVVLESLNATFSSNNLRGVVTTKEGIGLIVHIT